MLDNISVTYNIGQCSAQLLIDDSFSDFEKTIQKSDALQIDKTKEDIGNWINKTNNETQYIIYNLSSLSRVSLEVPFYENPIYANAIKAYWSYDLLSFEDIPLTNNTHDIQTGWSKCNLTSDNLSYKNGFLKIEIGNITNGSLSQMPCYYTGISRVKTEPLILVDIDYKLSENKIYASYSTDDIKLKKFNIFDFRNDNLSVIQTDLKTLEFIFDLKDDYISPHKLSCSFIYYGTRYEMDLSEIQCKNYIDANKDGKVNIIDLVRLKKICAGISIQAYDGVCDFDNDNQITSVDLVKFTLLLLKN